MGGGDVDLFIGYGGRTKMDKRVDSNLLLDMSGMLNDIGFNLDDELGVANMAEYHYDDGAVYGFPTKYENSRWILINEDMFKEAGLDIPYDGWTYSEFLADAEKLTHGEDQDKVYVVCWARKQSGKSILYALDGVLGANQIYKNEEGTEVNFDNDVYRAGLNLVKETLPLEGQSAQQPNGHEHQQYSEERIDAADDLVHGPLDKGYAIPIE